jgi:hypothetical protein
VVRIEGTLPFFFENKIGLKLGNSLSPVEIEIETNIIQSSIAKRDIQSIQMVPSCIKIGKEQLYILAHADVTVLIGKN